jgi:hypothetical protein
MTIVPRASSTMGEDLCCQSGHRLGDGGQVELFAGRRVEDALVEHFFGSARRPRPASGVPVSRMARSICASKPFSVAARITEAMIMWR